MLRVVCKATITHRMKLAWGECMYIC